MIRYDLVCDQGHAFDGWFANSAAYDRQADSSLISCPHCNSTEVQKAIMAPNLSGQTQRPAEQPTGPATYTAPAAPDPRLAAMIDLMRQIKAHMAALNFAAIPVDIRAMKRLWPDDPGLTERREREAKLFEDGLAGLSAR